MEPGSWGTREPGNQALWNHATGEPGNKGVSELGNQGTTEPGNQGTREPMNQKTRAPASQGVCHFGPKQPGSHRRQVTKKRRGRGAGGAQYKPAVPNTTLARAVVSTRWFALGAQCKTAGVQYHPGVKKQSVASTSNRIELICMPIEIGTDCIGIKHQNMTTGLHYIVLNPGSCIQSPGSWSQDPGPWAMDPGLRIFDQGSLPRDPGSSILHPRILDPGPLMLNPGSGTGIPDPRSWILVLDP